MSPYQEMEQLRQSIERLEQDCAFRQKQREKDAAHAAEFIGRWFCVGIGAFIASVVWVICVFH